MFDSSLSKKLNLWGFEKGLMVFSDGSLGAGFEIRPIDVNLASDERLNELKSMSKSFLNGLPQDLRLQFIQDVTSGNDEVIQNHAGTLNQEAHPLIAELTKERIEKFNNEDANGLLPVQKMYLLLRKPFSVKNSKRQFLHLFKKQKLTEKVLNEEITFLKKELESISQQLHSIGFKPKALTEESLFNLAYNQWNPDRPVAALLNSSHDVRDQIAVTDVVVGPDYFKIGRMYHKVLSLKLLPDMSFATMSNALIRLPFDSKLFVSIETLDMNKEQSKLQTQRRMAYASIVGKKGVADLEAKAKLSDIEGLLENIIQNTEKVFNFSIQVVLRSVDLDELDQQVSDALSLFRELSGAEAMIETVAAFDIFNEVAIPQVNSRERSIKITTSVLADFLPLYGNFSGFDSAQMLLRNMNSGLFAFDPFAPELANANQIISGGSGIGKSFSASLMFSQVLKSKPKIFILDIGASYKRFIEQIDGQYIDLGVNSKFSINPLSLDGLSSQDQEAFNHKIKFIGSLIEIMTMERGSAGLGRLARSEIERLVQELLTENKNARLSDLQKKLFNQQNEELKNIGKILSIWCGDSPYAKIVDRDTNVNLAKDVICFDLKSLEGHPELQSVMLFLITDLIWRVIQRDRTEIKFIFFDECWRLLENDQGAEFIGSVFRTVRKYGASAVAISQSMDDFSKSKIANALLPNASVKWILKQNGSNFENLKSTLQLNNRELDAVSQLKSIKGEYSECLLMAGDYRQLLRIEPTPIEYWLATTSPKDLSLWNEVKNKNLQLSSMELTRLLAAQFPRGAK